MVGSIQGKRSVTRGGGGGGGERSDEGVGVVMGLGERQLNGRKECVI